MDIEADLEALEQEYAARVGVAALDLETGRSVEFRADERFGFASTLKLFVAAEFLRQTTAEERDAHVTWTQTEVDAAGYSPVTSVLTGDGLSLAELAEAAVRESDNAATNLVIERLAGPAGLQEGLAQLGDTSTRIDGIEPGLNDVDPETMSNTTTPAAFTANLAALMQDDHLSSPDRDILIDWMTGNATGEPLVRAGAPAGWVVADKSGGAYGIRNDIAIVLPPDRQPILLTILSGKNDPGATYEDELVARAAAVVLAAFD